MGEVTVGRRLSQEWARCDDGTATVARMGEVTVQLLTTVETAVSRTLMEFEKMCLHKEHIYRAQIFFFALRATPNL